MTDTASAPTTTEVREALARILGSASFAQAGRSTGFLRYVVEETLAGRADRLKGLAIAVDVFGRPADFDAQGDPLVRVEASRLRRRLLEYYAGEGREDRVRIDLRRGSYVPQFRRVSETRARVSLAGRRLAAPLIAVPMLAVVLLLGLLFILGKMREAEIPAAAPAMPARANAASGHAAIDEIDAMPPRLIVLPIGDLSGAQDYREFAAGITEELNNALVAFDIVATISPNVESSAGLRLMELRESFQAGYALLGSIRVDEGRLRLVLRAMDTARGTQFWTMSIDEVIEPDMIAQQQRLAIRIARLMASPFGPIFGHEIERIGPLPADALNPYQCLLRFYDYARSFDPGLFGDSVRCMERTTKANPRFAEAWSALATLYLHEHNFGFSPRGDYREPPLGRALEAVRNSLDIDGNGRVAAITMAGIQRLLGDAGDFERAIERALSLEPSHPAVEAQIGFLLILEGDAVRGRPLIDSAIEATANVPGWYYVAHCFGALEQGQYDLALDWALQIDAPTWYVAPLAVAASAGLAGRGELAAREVTRLLELYPEFRTQGRRQLEAWLPDDALRGILIQGLERAGLPLD